MCELKDLWFLRWCNRDGACVREKKLSKDTCINKPPSTKFGCWLETRLDHWYLHSVTMQVVTVNRGIRLMDAFQNMTNQRTRMQLRKTLLWNKIVQESGCCFRFCCTNIDCGVWNGVECRVQSVKAVECWVGNVVCRVWSGDCGVRSVECKAWSV